MTDSSVIPAQPLEPAAATPTPTDPAPGAVVPGTIPAPAPAKPAEPAPAPASQPAEPKPAPAAPPTDPTPKPQAPKPAQAAPPTDPAPKPADPKPDAGEQLSRMAGIALDASARAAASEIGIRPDRIAYAVKLADLGGIDVTADGAAEKIAAAIAKVAEVLPELKGSAAGTGSLGNHPRKIGDAIDPFERGFDKG